MSGDPMQRVWDALDRADCAPRGAAHNFHARCPAHGGDGHSLHVSIGGDGRALLWCHAHQCKLENIVSPLGLAVCDLFPAGHRFARRRDLRAARRSDFHGRARTLANALLALEQAGQRWSVELRTDCPHCGAPGALLCVSDRGVFLSCPGDEHAVELGYEQSCSLDQFLQALAGRLEDTEEAA